MSATRPALRPHGASGDDDGGKVVECRTCGLLLRQVDGFDPDVALGTFLAHHPSSPEAIHIPDVPAGWSAVTVPAA